MSQADLHSASPNNAFVLKQLCLQQHMLACLPKVDGAIHI